jgi:hypothetical protein
MAFPPDPSLQPSVVVAASSGGRKRSTGKMVGAGAAVVALVAAGVFAVTKISSNDSKGGAGSSREVGTKLTDSLNDEDILGVVDLLLPGERETFRQPLIDMIDNLKRIKVLDDTADPKKVPGLDIVIKDVTVQAETPAADDIDTIRITGNNESSINGEKLPIGDLLIQEAFGGKRPAADAPPADQAISWSVTTVKKDGRWYLSLFYSLAEQARSQGTSNEAVPSQPVALQGAKDPEGAVDAMVKSVAALDLEGIIGGLNPNEAEALQRYAPLFIARAQKKLDANKVDIAITDEKYDVHGSGSHRSVTVSAFTATGSAGGDKATVTYGDGCFKVQVGNKTSTDTCGTNGIDKSLTSLGLADNQQVNALISSLRTAFADFEPTGIAVDQVGGKWYVSPIGTSTDFINAVLKSLTNSEITDIVGRGQDLLKAMRNGDVTFDGSGDTSSGSGSGSSGTPDTVFPDNTVSPEGSVPSAATSTDNSLYPDDTVFPGNSFPTDDTVTTGDSSAYTTADFAGKTQTFIEGEVVTEAAGTELSAAYCAEPRSTDPGTTYQCAATDADGALYDIDVVILSVNAFRITDLVLAPTS